MSNLARTPEPRSRSFRFDLRFGDWGLHVRDNYIEIYRANREDLAHLSLFLSTTQGALDFHLSFDHDAVMRGESEHKARVPLLNISLKDLALAGEAANSAFDRALHACVKQEFRRFHPDWLRRNDYFIIVTPLDRCLDLFKQIAPRHRGKYRLDPSWEKMLVTHSKLTEIFEPNVLHELERAGVRAGLMSDAEYQITAVKLWGGEHQLISLSLDSDRRGRRGWWGVPHTSLRRVHENLLAEFFDWLHLNATEAHRSAWESVVAGLGLHETEAGRTFADNVRQSLRGRNPVLEPFH